MVLKVDSRGGFHKRLCLSMQLAVKIEANYLPLWLFICSAERTFSANRQSLHICYINDSCSSDESDDEYSRCNRKASISFSPLASPFSSSAKAVDKTHKSLHSSSNTSRNSLDCSSLKSDDFSVRVVPDEGTLKQYSIRHDHFKITVSTCSVKWNAV